MMFKPTSYKAYVKYLISKVLSIQNNIKSWVLDIFFYLSLIELGHECEKEPKYRNNCVLKANLALFK